MSDPPDYRFIAVDRVDDGAIVVVSLNRPRQRNAQNRGLLVELDDALMRAEADDAVRVVVLRGEGPSFSAGHDLGSREDAAERAPGPDQHPSYRSDGAALPDIERTWRQDWRYFFSSNRRWRDLRKITIASVRGPVYAAGLMLMWACDLIVADETAEFADVVGTRLGMCGVEYFAHPWELGARRTKELLLTGDSMSVQEAQRIGMVSKIFDAGRLDEDTLAFARRIARVPSATALMIKESVNQTQDNQGFFNSLQAAFTLHELNHAQWAVVSRGEARIQTAELGGPDPRAPAPIRPADPHRP